MVSYSRAKGLFAGANFDGSTIGRDDDTTRALFGVTHPPEEILEGRAQMMVHEPAVHRFLSAVRAGFGQGHVAAEAK
jgi:lipid-binding SYLF domain-containing protein